MTDRIAIALAQINPKVGDFSSNVEKIRHARAEAAALGADLVAFSECVVTGYPAEDLFHKQAFLDASHEAVESLAAETADGGPALLVGAPWRATMPRPDGGEGYEAPRPAGTNDGMVHCFNAYMLLDQGVVKAVRFKHNLPNYGVFDEPRVFAPGPLPGPIDFRGVRLGVPICEDIWTDEVPECLAESGAEILVVPNGSPFESDKTDERVQISVARVTETGLPLIYLNQLGGQDDLVFDGASFALDGKCNLVAQLPAWREAVSLTVWERDGHDGWACTDGETVPVDNGAGAVYQAMVLGLRDYVTKSGFPGVIIGLSGGIDSALTAAVATDALGPERVHCVMMPSPYTSQESLDDAADCARRLGVHLDTVPIAPAMGAFDEMLRPAFEGRNLPEVDVTHENIQSRSRGIVLMAMSNKLGHMVLSTGNKSETSVGYSTLYGDMCGGFNVLKDLYKTTVWACSRWRNQHLPAGALGPDGEVVPPNIIAKPPTAELKPDQQDTDSLPPYEDLDPILQALIEEDLSADEIVARGHDRATVNRVWRLLENAEYKRRQAPPGVKITRRAFGRDRRYPIVNGYKGSV